MIKSMTGYGTAKGTAGTLAIEIELKSVNNRYLDVNARLPRAFLFAEEAIKSAVSGHITRGKVDIFVTVDSQASADTVVRVDENLAAGYMSAIKTLAEKFGINGEMTAAALSRYPNVLTEEKAELDRDSALAGLVQVLESALCDFDKMRAREGEKLCADISDKLNELERLTGIVEERSPQTVTEYREKLEQRMREVLENKEFDEARIIQEAAIFADKVAVDEETVRLHSHISQFRSMLEEGSPIGRKLDFITQELNREANTTGSKCNDAFLAKVVVDMKSEIEKIREQIQNIE